MLPGILAVPLSSIPADLFGELEEYARAENAASHDRAKAQERKAAKGSGKVAGRRR